MYGTQIILLTTANIHHHKYNNTQQKLHSKSKRKVVYRNTMTSWHFRYDQKITPPHCHTFVEIHAQNSQEVAQLTYRLNVWRIFSKRQRITLRLLYAMSRPSVVCLSVVCDVGAPYSGG